MLCRHPYYRHCRYCRNQNPTFHIYFFSVFFNLYNYSEVNLRLSFFNFSNIIIYFHLPISSHPNPPHSTSPFLYHILVSILQIIITPTFSPLYPHLSAPNTIFYKNFCFFYCAIKKKIVSLQPQSQFAMAP